MSENLEKYRTEINKIDEQIISLLCSRFNLMPKIAEEKLKMMKEVIDCKREEEMINKRYTFLKNQGYDDLEFTKELFSTIMSKSKKLQKEFIEKN